MATAVTHWPIGSFSCTPLHCNDGGWSPPFLLKYPCSDLHHSLCSIQKSLVDKILDS